MPVDAPTLVVFILAVGAGGMAYRRAGGNVAQDLWPISRGSWPKTVAVAVGLSVFVIGLLIVRAWPK
jgi:hypothetical protein